MTILFKNDNYLKVIFNNPLIKQAISEIRFNPSLKYHNNRVEICENFLTKLPYWRLDIAKINMYDQDEIEKSKKIFGITSRGASLLHKDVGHFDNFKSLSSYLLKNIVDRLEISELQRLGIRYFFLCQCDIPFDQLKKIILEKLYTAKFIDKFESEIKISDLAYVLVFTKESKKLRMAMGPVTKKEISEKFNEEVEEGSESSLLFDIDCYLEKTPSNILDKFHKESYGDSQSVLQETFNYIKS